MIRQVSVDFLWMLQNESDRAVDPGERTDGGVGIKDRLGGPPIPKIVGNNIKANARAGNVVTAIALFDILALQCDLLLNYTFRGDYAAQ